MSAAWRAGPWCVLGEPALFAEARSALDSAAAAARSERGERGLGPTPAYFKGSPLRPWPALRHALRRAAGLGIPRLCEFQNLEWLRSRGFLAARPLLAGVRTPGLLPRYQFLFTELRPGEPTLAEWLPRAPPVSRAARLAALARDVARMHALGFVHRDLFPRNLLVPTAAPGAACVFLDCWRGGPRPGLRGPDHDLGCLFLDGASLFTLEEQGSFLDTYEEERARLGHPPPPGWPARLERARAAVFRREARRRAGLPPNWRFPTRGVKPTPPPID